MDDAIGELDATREGYKKMAECESTIHTISNGEIENDEQRRKSSKIIRPSSSHLPHHDKFLTFDNELNFPQVNSNANRDHLAVIGNIVKMPTCPR
ncbi:unnamed protein product [Rotaria sp. Silwood1]|nr:unnamed protein product [Rotaria sp. Silwood1]CAF1435119.1 unnamed protein product [Rotaria sp. Silwood1]CAF5107925.1 unnamed protein product [Rotaria sp. Silwood1]